MEINLKNHKIFLIGAGGSGMSSLAQIILDLGTVTGGQDNKRTQITDSLENRGLKFFSSINEISENYFTVCIYSSAINKNVNEYYKFFENENCIMLHRSKALHLLFSRGKSISVAGSHGKTSTTAMLSQILEEAGLSPSYMVGGEPGFSDGVGGKLGNGEWHIYESDESDGTFLNHKADIRLLTNIDNDHLDYYKSLSELQIAFTNYIGTDPTSIVCLDDPGIESAIKNLSNTENITGYTCKTHFNLIEKTIYNIDNGNLYFKRNEINYTIQLPYPGDHYLKNALCAILAAEKTGIDISKSISILEHYRGVKRRFEFIGSIDSIKIYDDYGHHPTEILSVINAVKSLNKRCVVLFQPHRFTRTRDLYKEFASSLEQADKIFLLPIYSAGESPISGINSELIKNHIHSECTMLSGNIDEDILIIKSNLIKDDVLVTLGAGNVRDWGLKLIL